MYEDKVIGKCPRDGREWDCQCARCGSSIMFEDCDNCGGEGYSGHDCGEDCCCCADPDDNVVCSWCGGEGAHAVCCSSAEWCEANPVAGREGVKRGTVEWFTFDKPRDKHPPIVRECGCRMVWQDAGYYVHQTTCTACDEHRNER